jgi:hypothetical protein
MSQSFRPIREIWNVHSWCFPEPLKLPVSIDEPRSTVSILVPNVSEITPGRMRRFADTARIPASPLWKIAVETAERAVAAWKDLEHAELLPKDLRASIDKQILAVAATVK